MHRGVIVYHGGSFVNNVYEGGLKDFIPLPIDGITFLELLTKLEGRLDEKRSVQPFDVFSLVRSGGDDYMRMKVTDQFEWATLMDMTVSPTVYVITRPRYFVLDSSVLPPFNPSTEMRNVDDSGCCEWVIPGVEEHVSLPDETTMFEREPNKPGKLVVGAVFPSKDRMVSCIHSFHLKNFVEFRTSVSDLLYYHVQCKHVLTCVFSLRSRSFGKAWRVYEFVAHTCKVDIRTNIEPRVSTRAVAELVVPHMLEDGFVLRPKDIQGQLQRDFGVRLKYTTALNGRKRALKAIYGDHDKSFQMIAKYLYMLEHMNPGSIVDLQESDEDSAFQYCYFALAASIRAFRACRPVVVIDATHLKGKYKGVLFVASTKDSNEQIVPLAFGIGDKENDSSWTWFLQHIRLSFGSPPNMLVVSDQHKSIQNAVKDVFPGTPHGFCTYHIQGNLKPKRDGVLDLFHDAANAYREQDFDKHMLDLEKSSQPIHAKLMEIGPERWARCKCPVCRYAFGTSNAVEVLNSRLIWARSLPVVPLLEYCRQLLQSWFYKRRTHAQGRSIDVSEYAEERLNIAISKANFMTVQPISDTRLNIISGQNSYVVDLSKRDCSCKVFDTLLIPCKHACAAMRFKNHNPMAYVHPYYLTTTWREIYAQEIMHVPDPKDWVIPPDIDGRIVCTPVNPKQAGRPRVSRIPSGHENRGCPSEVRNDEPPSNDTPKRRKPKTCGICAVPGHTRVTCKDPRRFE